MTSEAAAHVQVLRDRLAKARALKQIIRDTPDRLTRDDAIIAYTRTLDLLVEDLIVLEDLGVMAACIDYLSAADTRRDDPPL
ncbi:hypothetical protein [Roseovarius sp. M141]|uniref:hypothetical protein n=1 Tax=Roseovarius sp. M141 TaxID=2583806 RepID=UPI0020CB80B3|nr:hypothetical protein [Roseovarius sp. M141]MCQ0094026.1 hypothetical protein [Roseovarius sp. M141]